MAGLYGSSPNVIYEIANEPNGGVTWNGQIRPYALEVTDTIRSKDPDNLIIVGTGTWSQDIHDAADNQLPDPNTLYALHFMLVRTGSSCATALTMRKAVARRFSSASGEPAMRPATAGRSCQSRKPGSIS